MFKDKVLLITGGTGSFGKAVIDRFLTSDIKEIRIFSRDEKKQEDLRIKLNAKKLQFVIGDVREPGSLNDAMAGVDYVFHAAALKQVPSCEFYPMEAIKTNILGTENVLNAAISNKVERVIFLSTDKAVYPINAMGISKAMAEKIVIAKSRLGSIKQIPIMCITRYGNVMCSRGSVIPLFIDQIRSNQDITITDPNMTRFLMSLENSVDLVMHAFLHGEQGDLFVQKAPACTIADLGQVLLELFNSKKKIQIIGTRHGEKLFETLVSREELSKVEDQGAYYRVLADNRDLNYKKYFVNGETDISILNDYNSHNTSRLNRDDIKKTLLKLDFIQRRFDA
jgi:UDP-glucose 4-epimerase